MKEQDYADYAFADGFYADKAIRADYMSHVIDYYIQLEEADVAKAKGETA